MHQFFDPARIVVDEDLTLAQGAIKGWDRRNYYYYHLLTGVAEHYGFDTDTPWSELSEEHQNKILYGTGKTEIDFSYVNDRGTRVQKKHPFEGIINNIERRYHDTESQQARDELAKLMATKPCGACGGSRLNKAARHVWVGDRVLPEVVQFPVGVAYQYFNELNLPGHRGEIASKILKEIQDRLGFLVNVGLDYLSLQRSADTLSGGEAQRIRLASQIGAGLVGVMYVLDEPSIGLHQRDNERLLSTLTRLRDLGNTVIVVEHDEDAIRSADYVIDIGPGAGVHGGQVVSKGTPAQVLADPNSLTGQYLTGVQNIEMPSERASAVDDKWLKVLGATGHNLKNVDLEIPVGVLTCVTGVSGSGKSTLINRTLMPAAARALNGAQLIEPSAHSKIEGLQHFDKVIDINQAPIGRTPRSNPATYTGIFTPIRELFAATEEARTRGYKPGRFSFNVKGGRCEACQGDGLIKVEMHFLPDVYVECDSCHGKRYDRETLEVRYKGASISEVLGMTIEDACTFFEAVPQIHRKLETLMDVGLGYVRLGQSATTLSGGEAQRVKLAKELSRRDTGRTLYILDEPTTGLHFHDIAQLLKMLQRLKEAGNTVVVIEHNLDVVKTADWVVDLGPEGGDGGGMIVATGTPEEVAENDASHTGTS